MQKTTRQTELHKPFDLRTRTCEFARDVIVLCRGLSKDTITDELIRQIIRSSGSVGANYREARESLSKKDSLHRMRIARKECKESTCWLELLKESVPGHGREINSPVQETRELRNILSAIIEKAEQA